MSGPKRYSELKRAIPAITEQMLAQHLKPLKEDNLINRKVEQEMADWAIKDRTLYKDLAMSQTI
jgi:DNA-binding HxlR family transcriptional regulator